MREREPHIPYFLSRTEKLLTLDIEHIEEDIDLYNVIQSFGLKQAALDGNDVVQEGDWRRSNGDRLTYFNWAKSIGDGSWQPNNYNGIEDYLYYYKDGSGKWGDYSPAHVVSVVCQKETG